VAWPVSRRNEVIFILWQEITMKKTLVGLTLATIVATVIGCASTAAPVSMRGAAVNASDRAPEAKAYSEKTPGVGEQKLISRTFLTQPPLVPHTVDKYVPITLEDNGCLECHVTDELRGKKLPKMGESHFSKTVKQSDGTPAVEMSRYQCDSCHVPQVDAKPLVDNAFVGVTKK
jgi:nitrate reductase (cytochrome), electron transfer subunit